MNDNLISEKKSAWITYEKKILKNAQEFSEEYKDFLNKNKTERLANKNIILKLEKNNFVNINKISKLNIGDKIYKNLNDKSVIACIVGEDNSKFNIIASHLDSPRLDLKQNPLIEDSKIGMFKTHYYGGIKKYQWVNIPLALYGVIYKKDGTKIEIGIGDDPGEPVFVIPDILPHLAKEQSKKEIGKAIKGEQLNVIISNVPTNSKEEKEKIKINILEKLNKMYGITNNDFFSAELEFVPALTALDVGFDKSMIGAYGQDDKVCAFTSLKAFLKISSPKKSCICFFADKEEIGSVGNTGAESFALINFVSKYKQLLKLNNLTVYELLENSKAISADVTSAVNPMHKELYDLNNANFLGNGVTIEKYGGSGGKYSTNDSNAKYVNYIRNILENNKISYQYGELGKIDNGGGGTIAMFFSRYGMEIIDAGVAVLGMHSPFEITSKIDIYSSFLLYREFFKK